jgi:uncharacterized membrane protein
MGLITWIIVAIVILAIIGLGWRVFVSGVFKGAQEIIDSNPIVKNITEKAKHYLSNITKGYA